MKPSDQIKELPPPPDDTATIKDARDWLREAAKRGAECPCCRRHTQFYKRRLHSVMALVLLRWYRHIVNHKTENEWMHVEQWIFDQPDMPRSARGDWAKLRYWQFIEEKPTESKSKAHSGLWRLTPLGIEFALGASSVQAHVMVYDGQPYLAANAELIGIREALGHKFNYDELMGRIS